MSLLIWIIIIICGLILLSSIFVGFFKTRKLFKTIGGSWKNLENNSWHGSKSEFLRYYQNSKFKRSGVYIHKNLTNGKNYVGQSKDIFTRVYREISGQADNTGCRLLYEDYEKGDAFQIILIFSKKGFPSLDKMERAFINLHNSRIKGYNRTYGNDEYGSTIYK